MELVKCLLQGMQLVSAGREAFDRRDAPAVRLHREHEARSHRTPIELHGAGAAHAVLAAQVGPGEAGIVADEVREEQAGLHLARDSSSVDLDRDRSVHPAPRPARSAAFVRPRSVIVRNRVTRYSVLPWRSPVGWRPFTASAAAARMDDSFSTAP